MQGTIDMRNVERIPSLEQRNIFSWSRFLLESVLAIGGALMVTNVILLAASLSKGYASIGKDFDF